MGEDFLNRSPFGFCPNSGDFSVDSVHKRLFLTPVTGEIFERQKVPNLIWRSWSELVDSYSWVYKSHKNQRNPISVYLTCRAGGHLANMPTIDIQCNLIWGSIKYKLLDGHLWNITQRNHENTYIWKGMYDTVTSHLDMSSSQVVFCGEQIGIIADLSKIELIAASLLKKKRQKIHCSRKRNKADELWHGNWYWFYSFGKETKAKEKQSQKTTTQRKPKHKWVGSSIQTKAMAIDFAVCPPWSEKWALRATNAHLWK